jgi:hypothetical protein
VDAVISDIKSASFNFKTLRIEAHDYTIVLQENGIHCCRRRFSRGEHSPARNGKVRLRFVRAPAALNRQLKSFDREAWRWLRPSMRSRGRCPRTTPRPTFTITRSTRSGSGTVSRPSLAFGLRLAQKFWMSAVEAAPPRRPIGICTSRRRVVHPSTGPPNLMLN